MSENFNPKVVDQKDLPLIVLVDEKRGFLSWIIKNHSEGNYNHIMIQVSQDFFASQDFAGFRKVKVETYLKDNIRLKFWQAIKMTDMQKETIFSAIERDLKAPWWKRRYDFLGIVGQFIYIKWLNNGRTKYCSERVRDYFKDVISIPNHPTPSDINRICKENPSIMRVFAVFESD